MNPSGSRKRVSSYNKITDEQKKTLVRHFDYGMTGADKAHLSAMEKAAEETSLTVDHVKVSH